MGPPPVPFREYGTGVRFEHMFEHQELYTATPGPRQRLAGTGPGQPVGPRSSISQAWSSTCQAVRRTA
jgi:hypothetical protein